MQNCHVQVWRICLEMVALSEYNDAAYVRQLWDVHMKATWDAAAAATGETDVKHYSAYDSSRMHQIRCRSAVETPHHLAESA